MSRNAAIDAGRRPYSAGRTHTGPIVVAVGGSDAESALRAGQRIARQLDASVLAISALEPLPLFTGGPDSAVAPPSLEAERKAARLDEMKQQLSDVVGVDPAWRTQVVHGDPASTITQVAREHDAPLIVMGIGRHRPIDRIVNAETTLRAVRRASCPVLAVAPGDDAPPREVVVATDFSAASAQAAQAVLPLLAPGATLHLLHVWEPSGAADPGLREIEEASLRSLPQRFARFEVLLAVPEGVTMKRETRSGKPAEQILAFADECRADLIVAGRHGLGLLERLLVGRVTASLLRGASCSVLITPEPSFADVDRLQRLLSGTSESRKADEWVVQLDEFTRRNRGRRTTLEVDDPDLGAQAQESGYRLLGATYDPRDRRVELMLGGPGGVTQHLTREIPNVESVAIAADARGSDLGLRIRHGKGQTLLTLMRTWLPDEQ